jgi:predicted metal-dependent HD superfamily phosphohydrolase
LTNYTDDISLINDLWTEIEVHYTDKKRFYHNLSHLNNLLFQLLQVKDKIENWETILFTLFYHDIVYNSLKSDNEERSAKLAEKRMKQINVPTEFIEKCKSQILATKKHLDNLDLDTNFFTDADLSILGQDNETYKVYFQNVRKEYSFYPDLLYNPGRKKVLKHFLEMDRIYKTDYFYAKFESQAKLNLQYELEYI